MDYVRFGLTQECHDLEAGTTTDAVPKPVRVVALHVLDAGDSIGAPSRFYQISELPPKTEKRSLRCNMRGSSEVGVQACPYHCKIKRYRSVSALD